MTSNAPPIAAAVIVKDGQLLMIRRREREGDLLWSLPGGKVEAGETAEQAAVRETLEETGLTVGAVKHLGERVHPDSGQPMAYVACQLLDGEVRAASPREVAEVAWVRLGEIPMLVPGGLFGPVQAYLDEQLSA
ncbi:hypothetical protein GCM10023080_029920 [Streptomyces pseudoechinosporeus]